MTHRRIAATVSEEGFTTPFGAAWSEKTVSNILKRLATA
jgi:hypothetical protein